MKHILTAAFALGLMASAVSASTLTFFTDKAAFDAATTDVTFTTDPFDGDIAAAETITFASGVTSTNPGGGFAFGDNSVSKGRYFIALQNSGLLAGTSVDWVFPSAVTAIGFDYQFTEVDGVNIQVAGETRDLNTGSADGFLGLVSTTALSGVTFGSGIFDSFAIDDLRFGAAPDPSVVPLPAGLPLLLAGLGGLAVLRARRKT